VSAGRRVCVPYAATMQTEAFSAGGLHWLARSGFRPGVETLCRAIPDPGAVPDAVRVKLSTTRGVWRMPLAGRMVYVKRQLLRGPFETLKYAVMPSRPEVEWRVAEALTRSGIPVAEPLAVGVARRGPMLRDAYFVCAEVPGVDWGAAATALRFEARSVMPLVRATVECLHRLEAERLAHGDLHLGNLIVRDGGENSGLVLIDLHAVGRARSECGAWRGRMRAKLAHSLWGVLHPEEFDEALTLLAPGSERRLRRRVRRLERTRLRSRSRRCTVSSSVFARERADGWRIWRRRELPLQALLDLVDRADAGAGEAVRVAFPEGEREVRVLRAGASWLPIWKGLHALQVRDIPAHATYACLERRSLGRLREAILVVEHVPGLVPLELAAAAPGAELEQHVLHTVERAHRAGLAVAASDLYFAPERPGWRVLRGAIDRAPPDRPLPEPQARRELDALRALVCS
jgi:hypothetical protein